MPKGCRLDKVVQEGRKYEAILTGSAEICGAQGNIDVHTIKGKRCRNCGHTHPPRRCPAYKSNCYICNRRGHWAKTPACTGRMDETGPSQKPRHQRSHSKGQRNPPEKRQVYFIASRTGTESVSTPSEDGYETDSEVDSKSFHVVCLSRKSLDAIECVQDEAFTKLRVRIPKIKGTHDLLLKIDTVHREIHSHCVRSTRCLETLTQAQFSSQQGVSG